MSTTAAVEKVVLDAKVSSRQGSVGSAPIRWTVKVEVLKVSSVWLPLHGPSQRIHTILFGVKKEKYLQIFNDL